MGLARVRKLVALSIFCACFPVPTLAYLQSRVGIGDRGGGRRGVLPAVVRRAVCGLRRLCCVAPEFCQRLHGEVGGHFGHVGRCR